MSAFNLPLKANHLRIVDAAGYEVYGRQTALSKYQMAEIVEAVNSHGLLQETEEALQQAFDFYMGDKACGDFTCSCNQAAVCGICEIREKTTAVLSRIRAAKGNK